MSCLYLKWRRRRRRGGGGFIQGVWDRWGRWGSWRKEEGGGREGKLGGHIKTARGHRCWIIWKPAVLRADPPSEPHWRRIRSPAAEPERRPSLLLSVLRCRQRINEPKRRKISPLRHISAFFGVTPGLPYTFPFIFTSFEDTCTSTDGKRSPNDTFRLHTSKSQQRNLKKKQQQQQHTDTHIFEQERLSLKCCYFKFGSLLCAHLSDSAESLNTVPG